MKSMTSKRPYIFLELNIDVKCIDRVDIVPVSLKQWQESSSLVVDFIKERDVLPL